MQAVPLGFFLFLMELAAGSLLITVLLDWDGEVSAGFLFLNGAFVLAFAVAGVWLRTVLPAERLVPHAATSAWLSWEVGVWVLFALGTVVTLFLLKTERRTASRVVGSLTSLVGVGALAVSGTAYQASPLAAPLAALSFLLAAGALGTVWSGMMLGHWYLVTPLLAPRPLLRINAGIATVVIGQALLLAALAAMGAFAWGSGAVGTAASGGAIAGGAASGGMTSSGFPASLLDALFWLRVGVGIVFPLGLAWMIWRTARVRSMMSATGLLYVALGAMLAAEIIAKSLFFITGVPV